MNAQTILLYSKILFFLAFGLWGSIGLLSGGVVVIIALYKKFIKRQDALKDFTRRRE